MTTKSDQSGPDPSREKLGKVLEPIELSVGDPDGPIIEMLLSLPLFQDLETKHLELLARYVKLCRVRQDAVLFREGEEGCFMGLIVEGLAELSKENADHAIVQIAAEGAGRTLGEMALVDGEPRSATVRFARAGKVLVLSKESFNRILAQHPHLAVSILLRICRLLSQRLRRTTGLLADAL